MSKEYHKLDNKDDLRNTNRVAIIGSLIALSIAIVAVLHSDSKILGLEIIQGSFVDVLMAFLKLFLWYSILSGTTFLITTGYLNGFDYEEDHKSDTEVIQNLISKWHLFITWLNKKSFSSTIDIFFFSFISIAFNIIAKLLGFYGVSSIVIATIITGTIIAVIIISVIVVKHSKSRKKS